MQHPIPGGTCEVRDATDLTARQRRTVFALVATLGKARLAEVRAARGTSTEELADEIDLTGHEAQLLEWIADALAGALIESWTLPGPVPASTQEVGALPPELRTALREATRHEGARVLVSV